MLQNSDIFGVILAGGQARRLGGGDKALKALGGKPLLAHVIERLMPQVSDIVINANGNPARFDGFGQPVVADTVEGFVGPLAGVLAGMEWVAANAPGCEWIVTVATDAPFFPEDLVARLSEAVADDAADMACAESGGARASRLRTLAGASRERSTPRAGGRGRPQSRRLDGPLPAVAGGVSSGIRGPVFQYQPARGYGRGCANFHICEIGNELVNVI